MITKDTLRHIVHLQKSEVAAPDTSIPRNIAKEISRHMDDKRVLILAGLRRSGKSTILKQMMKSMKDWCYVNFEDERFIDFKAQDFEELNEVLLEIYSNPKIYFFDEIQNIDKFETFVRRLQDEGKKIVITGSNASLLSKELGTRLTGRYKLFEIYPFSFNEFLNFKEISLEKNWFYIPEKKVLLIKRFNEFMLNGGLPEYLKNKDNDYIRTIYENILYRDIIARYGIKRQRLLKELVSILAAGISSQFTYNSLKKDLKLANSITVKEYISYLSNAYLFFELQKFDFSVRKQLNAPKKIYLADPAFNQMLGFNFSPNIGKVLENIVFTELRRRNNEIYYYSETNECDFVVKEGSRVKEAIQVCYSLNDKNREREIQGLSQAMDKFKLNSGIIITQEQEDEIKINNKIIKIIPAWKWLLEV